MLQLGACVPVYACARLLACVRAACVCVLYVCVHEEILFCLELALR